MKKLELTKIILQLGDLPVWLDRDGLVGGGHHSDQHVEQNDDVAAGVAAEHQQRPEPGEVLVRHQTTFTAAQLCRARQRRCM